MGRPSASAENRAFSVCFAHAVTKKSQSRLDFVARSGPLSLFSSLARLFPAYARTEDGQGFRDGVSEVQFNKELQKNGFLRVRDRRTCATRRSEDPTGAGMYLFSHLQWRDPADPEDREVLVGKYQDMVKKFPLITLGCKLDKFLDIVAKFHADWIVSSEQMGSFVEGENESDQTEAAQRSTSVSPGMMQQQRLLAEAQSLQATLLQGNGMMPPGSLAMAQLPMGAQTNLAGMGVPQNLNALQNQLTSSLLAVTLAKQQLQAASLPLDNKNLLSPFNNNGVNPLLQQALMAQGKPQPISPLSALQLQQMPQLPMSMS